MPVRNPAHSNDTSGKHIKENYVFMISLFHTATQKILNWCFNSTDMGNM
jgi:hypothetical protein